MPLHFSAIHDCKNDLHASFAVLLPFYIGSSELTFFDREVPLPYFQIQTDVKLPMDQPFAEIGACYKEDGFICPKPAISLEKTKTKNIFQETIRPNSNKFE